jgi:hypothetical protein
MKVPKVKAACKSENLFALVTVATARSFLGWL